MRPSYIMLAFLLAFLFLLSPLYALSSPEDAKLYLKPTSDTYISKECRDCKMFNESELRVGMEAIKERNPFVISHVEYRVILRGPYSSLIKFNLSEIPPGAEIKLARLWLYVKEPPEGGLKLLLYVLREKFNDTETTWIYRTSRARWKTSGGYAEPDYLTKIRVDETLSEGRSVGFLVTDYVKRVLSGQIEDYGLIIRPDVGKVEVSDFGSSSHMNLYVDFYSSEGAVREHKSKYVPTLYVEFVKPTAILNISKDRVTLERGESTEVTLMESGTFLGSVGLGYRIVEAPSLKVGPLKITISNYTKEPGFSANVKVEASKYAPPGKYVIEFYPDTFGYGSDVVEWGKVNLTVTVSGETGTEVTSTTESQTETGTPPTQTSEIGTTTQSTIETSTTEFTGTGTRPTSGPQGGSFAPQSTSKTAITVTRTTTKPRSLSPLTVALEIIVVVLLVAAFLLIRRR